MVGSKMLYNFRFYQFLSKPSSHKIDTNSGAIRFIYVMKVTGISKFEDRWGVKARKSEYAKTKKEKETKENTEILKGTGFILHLRTSGTFDVTLCWWIMVKVMLFVNGRLIRTFVTKIRSLVSQINQSCRQLYQ